MILEDGVYAKKEIFTRAIPVGLEPTTSGFEGRRAIHCAKEPHAVCAQIANNNQSDLEGFSFPENQNKIFHLYDMKS